MSSVLADAARLNRRVDAAREAQVDGGTATSSPVTTSDPSAVSSTTVAGSVPDGSIVTVPAESTTSTTSPEVDVVPVGDPVLVEELTSETTQVFLMPDGSYRAEVASVTGQASQR